MRYRASFPDEPTHRHQLLVVAPALDCGIAEPVLQQLDVVRHDNLHVLKVLLAVVEEQSIEPCDSGLILVALAVDFPNVTLGRI